MVQFNLPGLKINEPLSRHTSFQTGGPAKYFFSSKNETEVKRVQKVAADNNLALVFMPGKNVLTPDGGIAGVVIFVPAPSLDLPQGITVGGQIFFDIDLTKQKYNHENILRALDTTADELLSAIKNNILSVDFLMRKMGLSGQAVGGAKLSPIDGRFAENTGFATTDQFVMLISRIKTEIRDKTGILLSEIVTYIGF